MSNQETKKEVKFGFFKGIQKGADEIFNNFKAFICMVFVFGGALSVVNFILGQPVGCAYEEHYAVTYCSDAGFNTILKVILNVLIFSVFISRWQMVAFQHKDIKDVMTLGYWKQDVKAFLLLFFYFLLFVFISFIAYYLTQRKAIDNVSFEAMLFIVLSFLILIFISLMLVSFLWVRFFDGYKIERVGEALWCIFDNLYRIFVWFLFYMLFLLVIIKFIMSLPVIALGGLLYSFAAELLANIALLLFATTLQGVLNYEAEMFFKDNA